MHVQSTHCPKKCTYLMTYENTKGVHKIRTIFLHFKKEISKTPNNQSNEQNKDGSIRIDFKTYCQADVTKTARYLHLK